MLSLWGLWVLCAEEGFVWGLQASLAGMELDSKRDFAHLTILLRLLLCPWMCWGIQHSPVDGCSAVSCKFEVLAGEDEHTSFFSAILSLQKTANVGEEWMQFNMSLIKLKLLSVFSCELVSDSLPPHGLQPARLFCHGDSPGKNTEVGCYFVLQGNLPNPGIEPVSPALASGVFIAELPGRYLYILHSDFTSNLLCWVLVCPEFLKSAVSLPVI